MPLLRFCCSPCFDLRRGSYYIGLLSLLLIGVMEVAVSIYCLFNIEEAKKKIKFENALFLDPESDATAYIFFAVLLLVAIIYIVVCLVLLHGVKYKRRFLLMPWIFFTFMNMMMAITGGIMSLINSHGHSLPIAVGVMSLLVASIWIYFVIVVVSFFQALQDGDYW